MILMKFGGSTMANTMDIRRVAGIIRSRISDNPFIVLSAFKGVTDLLVSILKDPSSSDRIIDRITGKHTDFAAERVVVLPVRVWHGMCSRNREILACRPVFSAVVNQCERGEQQAERSGPAFGSCWRQTRRRL